MGLPGVEIAYVQHALCWVTNSIRHAKGAMTEQPSTLCGVFFCKQHCGPLQQKLVSTSPLGKQQKARILDGIGRFHGWNHACKEKGFGALTDRFCQSHCLTLPTRPNIKLEGP